ncbi:MAG TPA: thrombospondin type 3 repeat-containing protein, partial [Polyangiaceae bacterium]
MKSLRWVLRSAYALALLGTAAKVHAQTSPGFAVDRFDPAEKGSDWFASDSLDLRGHVRPAVGLGVDWAYKPLVVYAPDGSERAALLEHQVVLHPGASLVLFDRLRLGMDIPVALESGQARTVAGTTYGSTDTASLGDVRLSGDVRLVGTYGAPFSLAAGVAFYLPSGSRSDFTGDGTIRVEPRLLAAGTIGAHLVYAARAGVDLRPLTDSFDGVGLGTDLIFSVAAGVKTAADRLVIGPELFGSTILGSADGAFATKNTPLEAILGAHYTVVPEWRVGAGVGPGITRGLGAPEFRALASVEWAPAARAPLADADRDSIPDARDACPTVAGAATDDPRTNGCPPDRDGDGVPDGEDACPAVPGMHTSDPHTNGCPADADSDGVDDAHDACPRVPGLATSDPKTTGCPSDRDHDAIPDSEDACPMSPGVR